MTVSANLVGANMSLLIVDSLFVYPPGLEALEDVDYTLDISGKLWLGVPT